MKPGRGRVARIVQLPSRPPLSARSLKHAERVLHAVSAVSGLWGNALHA